MPKKCLLLIFGFAISAISGCADDQARAQIADTNARLDKLQGNVGVINNKVSDQKQIDILNKLDELQNQIDQLNGNVSTVSHDQKNYQATQDQLYQSIEQQIQSLQQATGQKVTSPKVNASEGAVVATTAVATAAVADKTSADTAKASNANLKSALLKIKKRNFPQAITELKNIINTSQDPQTVANATYYLTVTYAANSQYKDAIATGRKFATDNPDSPNAPDALRTVYISQKQLGMKQSAAKTANLIIQKYPTSDAAKKVQAEIKPAPASDAND